MCRPFPSHSVRQGPLQFIMTSHRLGNSSSRFALFGLLWCRLLTKDGCLAKARIESNKESKDFKARHTPPLQGPLPILGSSEMRHGALGHTTSSHQDKPADDSDNNGNSSLYPVLSPPYVPNCKQYLHNKYERAHYQGPSAVALRFPK